MSEESVAKEITNCSSVFQAASASASANSDLAPLMQPNVVDTVDQTVYSILKERRPCDSLIRSLNPKLRMESFSLLQGTRLLTSVVSGEGGSNNSGFVPLLGAVARLSDEERRKGRSAEIKEITGGNKGLSGIAAMMRDGSKTLAGMREATALVASSSAPKAAFHSMYNGVVAGDLFALAAGPITAVFAIELVLSRFRGRTPIGMKRVGQ